MLGKRPLDLEALRTVLKADLLAIFGTKTIGHAACNIMAGAQRIFGAATASRSRKILLRIIAFAASMKDRFRAIDRAGATCFARHKIQFFEDNDVCADACTAFLQTYFRHERITFHGFTDA